VRALQHEDAAVREQAAWALAHLGAAEGIEPLVARMAQEGGRTQRRFGIALEILTGVQLGDSARAWQEWLEREGADFVAGRKPLGKGRSALADALGGGGDPRKQDVYYYGIPQEGHSIVYVIDCSGSMQVSIKAPKHDANGPVDAGPDSRMEATKDALIEVLGKLTKEDKFNVVCFNDVVLPYLKSMTVATPKEIAKAQEWVRALHPASTTNIHDAMQEAFRLAGMGAQDKYYKSAVDTIFLLTDGSPTRADNQPDSTERILEACRRWNPVKHVVIHTIGIGKELNAPFLQQIAKENGGRFVQQ
jgi:Mg-chelatase subunit ChlD